MKMNCKKQAMALFELLVAMGILVLVMIPISLSFIGERREYGIYYHRAIALEVVDGEMEILRAGEWRAFPEGTQTYTVNNPSAANLPPGRFVLTRQAQHIRLQWLPASRNQRGIVTRETDVR
jgi:hypothetical protein